METGSYDNFHYKTLDRLVVGLVGGGSSKQWWNSPNRAFEGRKPIDLLNESEWERVRNYLMDSAYGGQYS